MRKPAFCICEKKDPDQLRGNREADQRLCFRYTDNTIPLLSKSEISSLKPSSVAVQPEWCRTRSETLETGFITTRLIYKKTCFPLMQAISKYIIVNYIPKTVWLCKMNNSYMSLVVRKPVFGVSDQV